jgi:hypothetical protein
MCSSIPQQSRLSLNKDGLIETHEDLWSLSDLLASLPLFGRLYRWGQQKIGTVCCALMNAVYAWKAGVPMRGALMFTNTVHAAYHPLESQKAGAAANKQQQLLLSTSATADTEADEVVNEKTPEPTFSSVAAGRKDQHSGAGKKSAAGLSQRGEHKGKQKERGQQLTGDEKAQHGQ